MSLYIKYRPRKLGEVAGHKATIQSIITHLEQPRRDVAHAWLFTGASGVGKTTLARIVARHLGATESAIKEYNSASLRGIDGVREIEQAMRHRTIGSEITAYILDECHQLTKDAQTALLKMIEEPPPHVYFLLCTTNPQNLIPTVRNRPKGFVLRPLGDTDLTGLLVSVATKEKFGIDNTILKAILANAGGSARLALNMLEAVRGVKNEKEAKRLIADLRAGDVSTETDYNFARRIFDVMIGIINGDRSSAKAWKSEMAPIWAELFDSSSEGKIPGVKACLCNIIGADLRQAYDPKLAKAVLLLETNQNLYDRASFVALLTLAFEAIDTK